MAQLTPPTKGPGGRGPGPDADAWGDPGPDAATTAARELGAPGRPAPFAWQHGSLLLLLARGGGGWILAELRFDADRCRYLEVRRARDRWPREAGGALLGRALRAGHAEADRLARDLDGWFTRQQSEPNDPNSSPSPSELSSLP